MHTLDNFPPFTQRYNRLNSLRRGSCYIGISASSVSKYIWQMEIMPVSQIHKICIEEVNISFDLFKSEEEMM